MKRLIACSRKYILLCALIGLLTTPSLAASSPCELQELQLTKSLLAANIEDAHLIVLVNKYVGFWLDEETREGEKLMEEGHKIQEKAKQIQEVANNMRLKPQQIGWEIKKMKWDCKNMTYTSEPYTKTKLYLSYTAVSIKSTLEKANGEIMHRKGLKLRLKALYEMENLNKDKSSKKDDDNKKAWSLIWSSFENMEKEKDLLRIREEKKLRRIKIEEDKEEIEKMLRTKKKEVEVLTKILLMDKETMKKEDKRKIEEKCKKKRMEEIKMKKILRMKKKEIKMIEQLLPIKKKDKETMQKEDKRKIEEKYEKKRMEEYKKRMEQYEQMLTQGCSILILKYNTLMMGRRSNDKHPWECLEKIVDFLLSPTTPRRRTISISLNRQHTVTNIKHTKEKSPIL